MRVYLDAMLNRGLVCLDATAIHACTANRLSQLTVVHAKGEGRAIAGVERALQSLGTRLDLSACDAFLLLFHTGPDMRLKEIHWGIQAFRNAVRDKLGDDYVLMVGHLPHRDEDFAVSLMVGHTLVNSRLPESSET
jgi:cell division GTPase FtsZ